MDFLYESYIERKRLDREQAKLQGKRIVSSFTVRENDDLDEMFGNSEGNEDDAEDMANENLHFSTKTNEVAKYYGLNSGDDD